ncbi:uncharacterized protein LOC131308862 isoform X2 [Rhododendron vialii]|nr:uncharacterized protein LOC131308862 isoform X2 [Rhododendron vialii]XP_058191883.1 uncharacterized protein LOC131308862 isoform X2 [Rhododendron vialii]XP_058191884.1 uncharacterized protein LOC131308862 isoform X2 [Rhododendron vialii]XP_058191885.1 uncharacterized protein LOC131308862 isoform X2 [Rhododendron vialii]
MDAPPYNNNTSRVSKLQNFKGNVSPLNTQRDSNNSNHQFFVGGGRFHHPSNSPTFDPYTSSFDKSNLENLDPAALIRYLRSVSPASPDAGDGFKTPAVMIGGSGGFGSSSSPLRAVENLVETLPSRSPPVFKTPVKVEEDVLVMDGILVGGSVSGGRMRLSAASDPSGGTSSSGSNSSAYKREICRSWEDSSFCRHGSKCQFAHGKEEVRPSRFPSKTKSEICKSYSGSGSCSYGAKCRFSHHKVITASSPTERAVAAVKAAKTQSISPIKPENSNDSTSSSGSKTIRSSITVTNTDWSPMDDGIMVSLPSSASVDEIPSREAVDAYINSVLYGPPHGKRLPVFAEICPE